MNETVERDSFEDQIIDRVREHLEQALRRHHYRAEPVTTLTYAQSIDGCIAATGPRTLALSNSESQKLTHQVRAIHDAILIGVNTVLTDDPQLTVRLVEGRNPQPVIVDSRLRFPLKAKLLRDPCVRPIIAAGHDACKDRESQLIEAGAQVVRGPLRSDGRVDLSQLLIRLKQLGFRSVMVEGGAMIITNVLAHRLADQLLVTICPRFVGGFRAVQTVHDFDHEQMPCVSNHHYQLLAGDLIVRGDLQRGNGQPLRPPNGQSIVKVPPEDA